MEKLYELLLSLKESISRTEERLNVLLKFFTEVQERMTLAQKKIDDVATRLTVIESNNGKAFHGEAERLKQMIKDIELKLVSIGIQSQNHENRWKIAFDFVFKLAITILGTILTWKLSNR